jgi:hypothetical protein
VYKEQWRADAREYGRIAKKGGWWLAYLAARNVVEGTGNGRPPKGETVPTETVSARQFAEEAGTSPARVLRHLEAWDRAADNGLVPPRKTFVGTTYNVPMPDDEDEPFNQWYDAALSVAPHIKGDRRADIIAAAKAAGVGASKTLDVAQNAKAVIAAVKADPALAAAIAADDDALLAVHREDNKRHTADDTPRRKQEADREPLTVSDALVMIGLNADLRTVLDRATAAAADGKGYAPEMREAMVQAVDETMTLATALRDVLTGKLGQPVTDEALAALLEGGVA